MWSQTLSDAQPAKPCSARRKVHFDVPGRHTEARANVLRKSIGRENIPQPVGRENIPRPSKTIKSHKQQVLAPKNTVSEKMNIPSVKSQELTKNRRQVASTTRDHRTPRSASAGQHVRSRYEERLKTEWVAAKKSIFYNRHEIFLKVKRKSGKI